MTIDELLSELVSMGFKCHSTASGKWKVALFHRIGVRTLVVLVRRRGVDLLETPLHHHEMINEDGLLRVSVRREGDRFAELAYLESEVSIHNRVLHVCSQFAQGGDIADENFKRLGIGPKEWGAKYGDRGKNKQGSAGSEMRDIYYAASSGDGEAAYLGDGMWITPSGSLEDRD